MRPVFKKSLLPVLWLFLISASSCKKVDISPDFTKHTWLVQNIRLEGASFARISRSSYKLEFTDGNYAIGLDVNRCSGAFNIPKNGEISFSTGGCTEVCCDSEFATDFAALLPKMETYEVKGDRLILKGKGKIELSRED